MTTERELDFVAPARTKLYDLGTSGWLRAAFFGLFFRLVVADELHEDESSIPVFVEDRQLKSFSAKRILGRIEEWREFGIDTQVIILKSAFSIFRPFEIIPRSFVSLIERRRDSFLDGKYPRFLTAILSSKYRSDLRALRRIDGKLAQKSSILTFCDAISYENLLAQYCRLIGVKTITTQHGLYRYSPTDLSGPNSQGIRNFVSDMIFTWGAASADEFRKHGIAKDRLVITGQLVSKKDRDIWARESRVTPQNCFGVVLAGPNERRRNAGLIQLADELSCKLQMPYAIRTHPADDISNYGILKYPEYSNPDDYFDLCKFSICAPTSFIVELINRQHRFFIMKNLTESEDVFDVSGCVVTSAGDVLNSLKTKIDFAELRALYDDHEEQVETARGILVTGHEQ